MKSNHDKETVLQNLLNKARIPALSATWLQNGETHRLIGGKVMAGAKDDAANTIKEVTLFQAASLSKPVSAAIVLNLIGQPELDLKLNTKLADLVEYGSKYFPELKGDPSYRELTIGMVIGQRSGLPNWFMPGDQIKFLNPAGTEFTYSGIAFCFLKEAIENKMKKSWEVLAQEFFDRVHMTHSTFLPPERTQHLKNSIIARMHTGKDEPLPPPESVPDMEFDANPAAGLLTTADDYIRFLQYCKENLKDLFHLDLNKNTKAHINIYWGLGMGVFKDGESEIAFHWGDNICSRAFCAINLITGDMIACFVNSQNGPNVFQLLTKNVVGNMQPVFTWLSQSKEFNALYEVESPEELNKMLVSLMQPLPFPQNEKKEVIEKVSIKIITQTNNGFFSPSSTNKLAQDDTALQSSNMKKASNNRVSMNKLGDNSVDDANTSDTKKGPGK